MSSTPRALGLMPVSAALDCAAAWRADASVLRRRGDEGRAVLMEQLASELEDAARRAQDDVLTLEQAAAESGMSRDHLRHLVAQGTIPNRGRRGAPRIRRGDLPRKPGRAQGSSYDPAQDAANLHRRRAS